MSASKKTNKVNNLNENASQNVNEDSGLKSENKVKFDIKASQDITSKNEMFIPEHILKKHEEESHIKEGTEVIIGVNKSGNEEQSNFEDTREEKIEKKGKKKNKKNKKNKPEKVDEPKEESKEPTEEITLEETSNEVFDFIPEISIEETIVDSVDSIEEIEEVAKIEDESADSTNVQEEIIIEEEIELEESLENDSTDSDDSNKNKPVVQKDKSIKTSDDKPEYVKEMLENRKARMRKIILTSVIFIVVILFSTMFAIVNKNSTTFLKGIHLHGVDISGMTMNEARECFNEMLSVELMPELTYTHGDYTVTILPEQIEFKYDLEDSLKEAYEIGRNGNIIQNNYSIIINSLFGKKQEMSYTYNEELLKSIVEDINSKLPGVVVEPSYYIEGEELHITKGVDGLAVRKDELKTSIILDIVDRDYEKIKNNEYDGRKMLPVSNVHAKDINIDEIYKEVYRLPKDAYFELEPYQIYPDQDGIDFKITVEEAKELVASEDKEEYVIPLVISKAEKTLNDLGTEAFPYLVSEFTTKYDASNKNRSTNLRIAAEKINGLVLMPGDVFSFNKIVGKRTVEEGYRDAKIYADGGVVDGLAGGICQISSTLYNAALLANLEIVERRNHTFTTSYLPAGKDATVVYGAIDFQFKNSRTYPIKIEASVANGIAEFKIHGMEEEKEYEIRILPVRTSSIPYSTTYEEDPTLLPGQEKVVQAGHAGYKVTTYKEVRYNGQVVSKDVISSDTYSPMRTIKKVAPGMIPPATP